MTTTSQLSKTTRLSETRELLEIPNREGEPALATIIVKGRTVGGIVPSETRAGAFSLTTTLVKLPIATVRNYETGLEWLGFLADLYEGKVK